MIVRPVHDGIQLITQPDHAHLARRVMEHCVALAARPRRDSILTAIGEHDNGWAEADAAPTVDLESGAVVDFVSAPLSVRYGVWPRGIARLSDDPWAAALVAQHAITVYDRFRADPAWNAFFAEMEAARDVMQRETGLPFGALMSDYAFVRLADLISLAFCARWTDPQRFGDWTVQLTGTRVVVTPDLFDGATIPIAVGAATLPSRLFRSDVDLRNSLRDATPTMLSGEVGAGPVPDSRFTA